MPLAGRQGCRGAGSTPIFRAMPLPPESSPVSRRGFFTRGLAEVFERAVEALGERVTAGGAPVRPPGALPEGAFVAACTRCGDCATACPANAIRMNGEGAALGTPTLDVATTACLACPEMPCAAACPTGALERPADGWSRIRLGGRITIAGSCITFRDVECGVCARVCPIGADALRIDEWDHPAVGDACVGCGSCIRACVTSPSSITIEPTRTTT